jgi:hypothetical protein
MMTPTPIHPDAQPEWRDAADESGRNLTLRRELAAALDERNTARTDARTLAGALDAASRRISALLSEAQDLRSGRALALMALDTLPSTDMLPEEGRALLLAATAHIGVVEHSPARARQWPAVGRCVACGGAHDVQDCGKAGSLLHADPIPELHEKLAQAQTNEERQQIVARIRLARAEQELEAARKAVRG